MKAVQYFTDAYLEQCNKMSPLQILQFQEDFRRLNETKSTTRLISIRISENLLKLFKSKCHISGTKYQTQIKKIMDEWCNSL